MERETSFGKKCYNCGNYRCHYTHGYMKFNREKTGNCIRHDKIVGHKDTCEQWGNNRDLKRRLSEASVKTLNETIAALIEITSIIKEDIEKKHLSFLAKERLEKKLDIIEQEINKPE